MSIKLSKTDKNIFIIGAGKLGEQVFHKLLSETNVQSEQIIGFIDDFKSKFEEKFQNKNIYHSEDIIQKRLEKEVLLIPAIGYRNLAQRNQLLQTFKSLGFSFSSMIDEKANISASCKIGDGTIILAGATLDSLVKVADFCYVDINVSVGEQSEIGTGCYIANNATICGNSKIGENTFVGASALIFDEISIGSGNLINAGSILSKDTEDNSKIMSMTKVKCMEI